MTETTKNDRQEQVEQIVDSAFELGRLWARHGLTIGKLALETSALSLGTTAKMLGGIADAFATPEKSEGSVETPAALESDAA